MSSLGKSDKIIWWLMVSFAGIIIGVAAAWANEMNKKVERIVNLEVTVNYMQHDLREIKDLFSYYLKKEYGLSNK